MEKFDARKLSTDAQQEIRYQVIRLKKQGHKRSEISDITGVHQGTISAWCTLYKKGGKQALKIKKRGRPTGSNRTLTPDQEKEIQKAIYDNCPDQMKLPFALWTRVAVQQLIMQLWSIKMPIRSVGEYLKRWGFTPQRPLLKHISKTPRQLKPGSTLNIRRLQKKRLKKMLKFTGEMKLVFATIVIMAEVTHPVVRPLLSEFIPGVKG